MAIRFTCDHCGAKLKAPDGTTGRSTRCLKCGKAVTIPEPIFDAEIVDEPGGGSEFITAADTFEEEDVADPYGLKDEPLGAVPEARRPCPMCGEMIVASAVKCRFCGEVFDQKLKKAEAKIKGKKKKKQYAAEDADLTMSDWIICILCSGIGCIGGIVWMIQGKPKGSKALVVSICASVFWTIIRLILVAAREGQAPGLQP